jgi:hypothetical protein
VPYHYAIVKEKGRRPFCERHWQGRGAWLLVASSVYMLASRNETPHGGEASGRAASACESCIWKHCKIAGQRPLWFRFQVSLEVVKRWLSLVSAWLCREESCGFCKIFPQSTDFDFDGKTPPNSAAYTIENGGTRVCVLLIQAKLCRSDGETW